MPEIVLASVLLLRTGELSESHNPLVGLSRPLPSSWPGGRVSARNPPVNRHIRGFFYLDTLNGIHINKKDFNALNQLYYVWKNLASESELIQYIEIIKKTL